VRFLALATALAACGTDAKAIELAIPGTQVLVTEKVNGGAWRKLSGQFDSAANTTTYAIDIGDEYELVVVCLRSDTLDGEFVAGEVFGTSDDAEITLASWRAPSCPVTAPVSSEPVTLTGTFDEPMQLAISAKPPIVVTGGVEFKLLAEPGRHDLIAYNNLKLVIERDLQLDADLTLDAIHLATDGSSMLAAAVDVASEDELVSVYTALQTRNGTRYTWANQKPDGALFVPSELLVPGDVRPFEVDLSGTGTTRLINVDDPARLGEATLLPKLASVMRHGDLGVSWTPIQDFYTTARFSTSKGRSSANVTASRSWLERHGKSQLDFDTAVDGYDPSWVGDSYPIFSLQRWSPGLISLTEAQVEEPM
jgi:hypothetical protein